MRNNLQRLACALDRVRRASALTGLRPAWSDLADRDLATSINTLPRGSGFDAGCTVDDYRCNDGRIVIVTSFHHMNENGYYCGWTNWTVTIQPGFDGPTVTVRERTTKWRSAPRRMVEGMADYIGEVFHSWAMGGES